MPTPIDPRIVKKILAIRTYHSEVTKKKNLNALILGRQGTGKTTLIDTCRKPVFVSSFDPMGTATRTLQPGIDSGDIIVQNYESDTWQKPTAYKDWERDMNELIRLNTFENFGTYVLDSLTWWSKYLEYYLASGKAAFKSTDYDSLMSLRGYGYQLMITLDWMNRLMALPCDVIVLGHITQARDDLTGEIEVSLLLPGKQSDQVPTCFCEKWFTRIIRGKDGKSKFQIQTKGDGKYPAESRIGGGKFNTFEPPNVKVLLVKAGLQSNDLPKLDLQGE